MIVVNIGTTMAAAAAAAPLSNHVSMTETQ